MSNLDLKGSSVIRNSSMCVSVALMTWMNLLFAWKLFHPKIGAIIARFLPNKFHFQVGILDLFCFGDAKPKSNLIGKNVPNVWSRKEN